jgi:hypothetical protein
VAQRLLTIGGKPAILPGAKTDAGQRPVAVDQATVAALRAHRARQAEERLAWGEAWQDHGLVFCRADGTPIRPTQLTRDFGRLARAAGLPGLTLMASGIRTRRPRWWRACRSRSSANG